MNHAKTLTESFKMIKRKKRLKLSPQVIKDKNGKVTTIMLKYSTYQSILDEISSTKKEIVELKKKADKQRKK